MLLLVSHFIPSTITIELDYCGLMSQLECTLHMQKNILTPSNGGLKTLWAHTVYLYIYT